MDPAAQPLDLRALAERARAAARALAPAARDAKDRALEVIASSLAREADLGAGSVLLRANADDVARAREAGLDEAMLDRLALDAEGLRKIAATVRAVAAQKDPVGEIVGMERRPNGLTIGRVRIPLGVLCMIYESRPNVTIDSAVLALKSGNAVLLRGGKEARGSNQELGRIARDGARAAGLPEDAIQIVPAGDRDEIRTLVGLTGLIDLVIPRGGEGLIRFVTEHAKVPVIQHYKGVCHMFVDEGADLEMAERLVLSSKLQRVSVCNALDCLLVHEREAPALLARLAAAAGKEGLELRGDARAVELAPGARAAADGDWGREFLAKILAVRVVASFDAALEHIARHGSSHTEAIVTRDYARAQRFVREVDASCVLVNASTRFNDGGELGLGAEMGISTSKLHAFGPMGLEHLTTLKWIGYGDGQVRGS